MDEIQQIATSNFPASFFAPQLAVLSPEDNSKKNKSI